MDHLINQKYPRVVTKGLVLGGALAVTGFIPPRDVGRLAMAFLLMQVVEDLIVSSTSIDLSRDDPPKKDCKCDDDDAA